MNNQPIKAVIEVCDKAISAADFQFLIDFYAEEAARPDFVVKAKENIFKALIDKYLVE
ncbi:hypothetical protein JHU04_004248 [Brenneria sp. 4F2]|nr:hypothetical protein [Brenneria bubanii]